MTRICCRHFLPLDHDGQCRFCRRRNDTSVVLHLHRGLIHSASASWPSEIQDADDAYLDFEELADLQLFDRLRDDGFVAHPIFRRDAIFMRFVQVIEREREWFQAFHGLRRALEEVDERLSACLSAISRSETDYACSHRSGSPQHCAEMVLKGGLVDDEQRGGSTAEASDGGVLSDGLDRGTGRVDARSRGRSKRDSLGRLV